MENPEYIVLVALDTPSRETGIYISGGVMAAPTVGAVMGDILPYLGVAPSGAAEEAIVEDLTGLTPKETEALLKEQNLTARFSGDGDTVTGQIPAAGQRIPGGSQVLVYLGEEPAEKIVAVPDFIGMDRRQAADAAGQLGLYIRVAGNPEVSAAVTVTAQDIPAGTEVKTGTTVGLQFADTGARD